MDPFERATHPIMKSLLPIVQGIAKTFGPCCEVVLHDLSYPRTSIIEIINSHVTGRKIGDGVKDLMSKLLKANELENDVLANYETFLNNHRKIKTTTMLIRDPETNELIGALCINYDLKDLMLIQNIICSLSHTVQLSDKNGSAKDGITNSKKDMLEILNFFIDKSIEETGGVPETMTKAEKIKIIEYLDEKGVFLVKGAIAITSKALKVSKNSIYNYIEEIRAG